MLLFIEDLENNINTVLLKIILLKIKYFKGI